MDNCEKCDKLTNRKQVPMTSYQCQDCYNHTNYLGKYQFDCMKCGNDIRQPLDWCKHESGNGLPCV